MTKKSNRIFFTLAALVVAVGIILALSFIGRKSQGPLEGLFSHAGSVVSDVESSLMIGQRKNKRENDLKWFAPYRYDREKLLKSKIIFLGAFDNEAEESFENIINFEDSLRTKFPFIHIYTAWGSKPEQQFPATQVQAILEMGSLPAITWEPWLTDFDAGQVPSIRPSAIRDKGGLADIAAGLYDPYIKKWAGEAKKAKGLILLRIGHEMNDPYRYPWGPHNNKAEDFVSAWRHIHNVFNAVGAVNIVWIWSPHPAYGWFDAYYPGDKFVDVIGVGALNYGTVASWSQWWTFDQIFGQHYGALSKFGKPLMITEFGSLSVGGNRSRWFVDALRTFPWKYPAVKSILFFHYSYDKTTTQQPLNWYIKNDPVTVTAIRDQLRIWPDSVKPGIER